MDDTDQSELDPCHNASPIIRPSGTAGLTSEIFLRSLQLGFFSLCYGHGLLMLAISRTAAASNSLRSLASEISRLMNPISSSSLDCGNFS